MEVAIDEDAHWPIHLERNKKGLLKKSASIIKSHESFNPIYMKNISRKMFSQ